MLVSTHPKLIYTSNHFNHFNIGQMIKMLNGWFLMVYLPGLGKILLDYAQKIICHSNVSKAA